MDQYYPDKNIEGRTWHKCLTCGNKTFTDEKKTNIKKYTPVWITKEGVTIPINVMATPHLLSAIHFIERGRMQQLVSIEQHIICPDGVTITNEEALKVLDYYTAWPRGYEDLLAEAEKRKLIKRK